MRFSISTVGYILRDRVRNSEIRTELNKRDKRKWCGYLARTPQPIAALN